MVNEIIIVKVDGREFETYIDEHGVQRFLENAAIRRYVDFANEGPPDFKIKEGAYTLNDLWIDWHESSREDFPIEDMMVFYTMMGYSVSGFADVFPDAYIENPRWEDNDE